MWSREEGVCGGVCGAEGDGGVERRRRRGGGEVAAARRRCDAAAAARGVGQGEGALGKVGIEGAGREAGNLACAAELCSNG